jgi:hypothetical protein
VPARSFPGHIQFAVALEEVEEGVPLAAGYRGDFPPVSTRLLCRTQCAPVSEQSELVAHCRQCACPLGTQVSASWGRHRLRQQQQKQQQHLSMRRGQRYLCSSSSRSGSPGPYPLTRPTVYWHAPLCCQCSNEEGGRRDYDGGFLSSTGHQKQSKFPHVRLLAWTRTVL